MTGIWDRPGIDLTLEPSGSPLTVLESAFVDLFEPTRSPSPPGSPTLIPTGEKVDGSRNCNLETCRSDSGTKNSPSEDLQILLERATIGLIITFAVSDSRMPTVG